MGAQVLMERGRDADMHNMNMWLHYGLVKI